MLVYLDMDDFLVRFSDAAYDWLSSYLGRPIRKLKNKHRWKFWENYGVKDEDFWPNLPQGFWRYLQPSPAGMEVYGYLKNCGCNVYLLTKVTYESPGCAHEKYLWVRKNMPDMINRLITSPVKCLNYQQGALLIDDNEDNISDWPGRSILWPTWANWRRDVCYQDGEPDPKYIIHELKGLGYQ